MIKGSESTTISVGEGKETQKKITTKILGRVPPIAQHKPLPKPKRPAKELADFQNELRNFEVLLNALKNEIEDLKGNTVMYCDVIKQVEKDHKVFLGKMSREIKKDESRMDTYQMNRLLFDRQKKVCLKYGWNNCKIFFVGIFTACRSNASPSSSFKVF